jgi:hypothetical protein
MIIVCAALLASAVTSFTHVRSTEAPLRGALELGAAHSELFQALVDRLNASDVVVHVLYDDRPWPGVAGHLTFAASAGGVRYLRIAVRRRLSGCDLVAILGHELQHAVEIADERSVVDQPTMAAFYATAGERRNGDGRPTFDTAAAIAAGDRVRREFLGGGRTDGPDRRPQAEAPAPDQPR